VAALKQQGLTEVLSKTLLRPYAQIVFSTDRRVGLLVLAAIAVFPRLALATLLAVGVAAIVVFLFGLGLERIPEGGLACTAALSALALGIFDPGSGNPYALVVVAAALAVLLTASFEAAFSTVALPTHSLPFIGATWLVHLAARLLPPRATSTPLATPAEWLPTEWLAPGWLDAPAGMLFLSGTAAGLIVLLAVALHSRIALLLAMVGWGIALALRWWLREAAPWSPVDVLATFNAMLTAMALGGVWFVPQRSSILLAAGGAAVSAVLAYALTPLAGMVFLPVLSLPFVATVHLVLMAARRRVADRHPHSAIPLERPEDMLARHLNRVRRFGDSAWLPFRLPFRGEWVVTQGYDGEHTHKGLWRHGLDFEGVDRHGERFTGEGSSLRDYHCFHLPVVAAGLGTVTKVVDGVEDNPPGQINTHDNWGNAVVIAHGVGLYSVYAHLERGSIRVKQGEVVSAGHEIARCGNSGRSPVPHLHFQIQRAAELGSPTLAADFGDVVTHDDDGYEVQSQVVPREGDVVRPVMRDEAVSRALAFTPGTEIELVEDHTGHRERAAVEVDLVGRRKLASDRAELFLEPYDNGFVIVDFAGDPSSLLRYLLLGIPRIPFDKSPTLRWRDSLPRRLLLARWLRPFADFAALFAPEAGTTTMRFTCQRQPGQLEVQGQSDRWTSTATLSLGRGEHRIVIEHDGREQAVTVTRLDGRNASPAMSQRERREEAA
jgi:murein DD-endopeptidase MepM/ murein hydrolase activator NlpD/urea transporter